MTKSDGLRVLLIDDHALFRRGLRLMLRELAPDMDLSEADSVAHAVDLSQEAFDLVLLDMHMPGASGLDALRIVKQAWSLALVVVLSGEESPQLVRDTIDQGACGFIPKSSTPEVMLLALQLVLAKGIYLPTLVLREGFAGPSGAPVGAPIEPPSGMTERQAQVLRLALKGAPNKVVARELGISEGTVKSHLSTAYRLLNVRNRTEALYSAARIGLKV